MTQIQKTVFISYRRKDISWALLVYQNLTADGYDVFFDFKSIPGGDFGKIIINNIKARAHFLVILTPSALDRSDEPGDWLRREIETAINEKRNIIPLFFNDFDFGTPSVSKKLTGKLAVIKNYSGLEVPSTYFDEAMDRLKKQYLNIALDAVLHPVSDEVQRVVKAQQVAANQAIAQQAVGILPDRLILKDIEFCRIQAGPFLMGSKDDNKLASDNEHPQHTLELREFYMARFPVTNEQFLKYTDATGYVTLAENEGGWNPLKAEYEKGYNWRTPLGRKDNPVVQITWQDAMAYVRWLNETAKEGLPQGYAFTLPTEAQWEKAARGEYGNEWPWGNEFDKARCNSLEGGKVATTPVDAYPSGASPFGVLDMVGNVWEWTHTLFKDYPYKADDGRESESESGSRVFRGGSFGSHRRSVRCSVRLSYYPEFRLDNFGFRVCVSPA